MSINNSTVPARSYILTMICRSCLRTASRSITLHDQFATVRTTAPRFISTTTTRLNATPISANTATASAPRQGSSTSSHNPPAATSTSAAQPFSEPITPSASPAEKQNAAAAAEKKVTPLVRSSVAAGTPLKGLNFFKDKTDPVALADEEYPEWLWTILEKQEKKDEVDAGDLFSKSKKQRRLAAKRLRKLEAANPGYNAPKIPLYEQTIDLPASDGTPVGALKATEARDGLTKAMRNKRRADIKEKNFLKAMG
ncbi:unnamed protein product [Periconia digitata]|uniref:Large ribosomal subunit protein mL54 n=1 Tax=Periconia digitata TaxID=1303443 RepID=A0A9W4U5J2_9PLEO|nr:unnamed protein product [Periconia digitata]